MVCFLTLNIARVTPWKVIFGVSWYIIFRGLQKMCMFHEPAGFWPNISQKIYFITQKSLEGVGATILSCHIRIKQNRRGIPKV
jgi:hypothetical protein